MRHRRSTYVAPRRSLRPALITGAVIGALVGAAMLPGTAHAAGHRENDLRGFCAPHRTAECVLTANDDDGIVFVDRRGHRHHPSGPAAALRYLRHHAIPCAEEDSARCFWDAGHRGNDVGESFMVTGGHAEGTGVVFYLQLA